MKLASFRFADGTPGVGVVVGDDIHVIDNEEHPAVSPMRAVLLTHGTRLAEVASSRTVRRDEVTIEPIVPDPGKIVAAPVNYVDHQQEMNEDFHIDSLGVFLKAPTSVVGHGGTVRLPYTDRRFDQEGELAVVIGAEASHLAPRDVLSVIAGYTVVMDMTMRGGEDRSTRKSFDTFTPVGPYLVTPDEAGEPSGMRLRTWVNGVLRQDADVADLIWDVPRLIAYASSVMVLKPGDIVSTGTPAGIGQVAHGDSVAVEIGGVGRLEIGVTSEGAVACPTRGATRGPKPPETVTPVRTR